MDSTISANLGGGVSAQLPGIGKKDAPVTTTPAKATPEGREQSVAPADTQKTEEQAVAELQKAIDAIQGPQRSIEFSVHKETHAIMIKVKNKETGDLIREVPPEKILDLAARMMEITGIIVDKKV